MKEVQQGNTRSWPIWVLENSITDPVGHVQEMEADCEGRYKQKWHQWKKRFTEGNGVGKFGIMSFLEGK